MKGLPSTDRNNRWIKELVAVGALTGGITWLFGGQIATVFRSLTGTAQNSVRDALPLEMEIERARGMVTSLVPMIRRNHEVIVREQVEIDELRTAIAKTKDELQSQLEEIKSLREELAPSPSDLSAAGRGGDARRKLRHLFSVYQSTEAALNARQQLVRSREASLAEAQVAQNDALRKKRELETEVVGFEARLAALRVPDRVNGMPVETAKMKDAEEVLKYIRKRLTIAERLAQAPEDSAGVAVDNELGDERIELEVDRYFAGDGTTAKPAIASQESGL